MTIKPDGLLQPQINHAQTLLESLLVNNFAWDGSGTGQGKTYVAAVIARTLNKKFVVISPKLNIPKWEMVLKQFGVKAQFIINYEKLARGNSKYYKYKTKGQKDIPYYLRGVFKIPSDWFVICDESHRSKGVDSLNAGLLYALKNQNIQSLFLSATQAMTPLDLRAFGYVMNLHKGMHLTGGRGQNYGMNLFKQFAEDAGAQYVGQWGAMYFDSENPESVKKLQAVRHNLFNVQKVASRMNREDFGDIFPHNQIECTAYNMGANGVKIKRVYDDMEMELAKLEERCENYSQHILAILTKARRLAELLKVPSLCEITEDLFNENKSIVIFVNFKDTIEALYNRLSKTFGKELIGEIHGDQTFKQRLEDMDAFQSDKKRIMLVNLAAGGESIDLQDVTGKHPRASLINPSYRAISVLQSIGRTDRAYAKSDVFTQLVLADGTIEASVGQKFNSKKGHLDIFNDGDLVPDGIAFKYGRFAAGMSI